MNHIFASIFLQFQGDKTGCCRSLKINFNVCQFINMWHKNLKRVNFSKTSNFAATSLLNILIHTYMCIACGWATNKKDAQTCFWPHPFQLWQVHKWHTCVEYMCTQFLWQVQNRQVYSFDKSLFSCIHASFVIEWTVSNLI